MSDLSNLNILQSEGTVTVQSNGSQQALDVGINVLGVQIDPRDIRPLVSSDQVTSLQGTAPWVISGIIDQGGAALPQDAWYMRITDGATTVGIDTFSLQVRNTNTGGSGAVNIQDGGNSLTVDGSVSATQSGTWNLTNISGTISLPTGAATESTLSTLNTKIPSNLTVTSNRLLVDSSGVTQPTYLTYSNSTTYSAAAHFTPQLLLPTDIFTISGSATKTIKIKKVTICGTNTGNTNGIIYLVKRSTANTGGTSTIAPNVKHDSLDSAATAVVRSYTVNPTLGTSAGLVSAKFLFLASLGSVNASKCDDFTFNFFDDKPLILRGTAESLCVNLNGTTLGGTSVFAISVEWIEE